MSSETVLEDKKFQMVLESNLESILNDLKILIEKKTSIQKTEKGFAISFDGLLEYDLSNHTKTISF